MTSTIRPKSAALISSSSSLRWKRAIFKTKDQKKSRLRISLRVVQAAGLIRFAAQEQSRLRETITREQSISLNKKVQVGSRQKLKPKVRLSMMMNWMTY